MTRANTNRNRFSRETLETSEFRSDIKESSSISSNSFADITPITVDYQTARLLRKCSFFVSKTVGKTKSVSNLGR